MIRRRWKTWILLILAVCAVFRVALPMLMLERANAFLADYSKVFKAHLTDIDISFIRMAYRLEGIEVILRKDSERVLYVDSVDVSLAWRELLHGIVLTDIYIRDARISTSPELLPAFREIAAENKNKQAAKSPGERQEEREEAKTIKSKFFPLRIERIVIRDSSFEFAADKNAPEERRLRLDQMRLRLSNVTPLQEKTKTVVTFESRLQRSAKIKGVAQIRVSKEDLDWDFDAELRGFPLKQANPFLLELIPFSFTEGTLDVFSEAKSEHGRIKGYVKPFLTEVDVIARKEKFRGAKHFLAEIAVAMGNVLAQRPKFKSVATKIDFQKAGPGAKLKVDALGALSNAVEHRIEDPIAPSVEDEITLQ